MLRYHKKVYIDPKDLERLKTFTERLNTLKWGYSEHCLENVKSRAIDLEGLLRFIKGIELTAEQIFEFYLTEQSRNIIKVCYRVNYGLYDIILVLNFEKSIITIYLNNVEDNHETLKRELYQNA